MAKSDKKKKSKRPAANTGKPKGRAFPLSLVKALAVAACATGIGFGYISFVQLPLYEADMASRVTQRYADQEATSLNQALNRLRERIDSAALSPLALQAIASQSDADVHLVEKAMLDYFPEAIGLRVLPLGELGIAAFKDGSQGLRSHIEIDLVRRAGDGEPTRPESFQFEKRWLTSIAQVVNHPLFPERRAVILITIDNSEIDKQLALLKPDGKAVLQQLYVDAGGRSITQDIASTGASTRKSEKYGAVTKLPDTNWQVAFTPSDSLLASLNVGRLFFYIVAVASILGSLVAVMLGHMLYRRQLASDSDKLLAAASSGKPASVSLPELVPVGEALQRLASQPTTAPVVEGSKVKARSAAPVSLSMDSDQEDSLELELASPAPAIADGPIPEHVFRAYDIRGNATTELSNNLVQRIGSAVGQLVKEHGEQQIILAYDGRLSSPRLREQMVAALLNTGLDVIDIGLVPTPLLYFATQTLDCRSGVMITGSHNPADDNGFKVVINRQTIHAGGIQDILQRVKNPQPAAGGKGKLINNDEVVTAYIDEVAGDISIPAPLKVVIDAGNGATGEIAPRLLASLGCEVVTMNCDIDGNFPDHDPDTSNEKNLVGLQAAVASQGADFGVAFDGDGDRIAAVTGSGEIVRTDRLIMLFAEDIVSRNPGADVVFDVKCSRGLAQLITQHGGRPLLCRTGHAFMKEKMIETGALLGGEFSGHIFFGERWYGHDDGMYAAGRLAEVLSTYDKNLEEALEAFPQTANTPEILVPVPEEAKFDLVEKLAREGDFADGKVNRLDGVRVDFNRGWGLVRASNTTAALTARFEADDESELKKIQQLFKAQLNRLAPELKLPF